jgi:hypothetical protein
MGKQLINEIHSGLGGFLNQQDHTHPIREIPEIFARNLDDTIFDCGSELYGIHAPPHLISNLELYDSTRLFSSWHG